jgi:hypothetical protein
MVSFAIIRVQITRSGERSRRPRFKNVFNRMEISTLFCTVREVTSYCALVKGHGFVHP